MNDDLISRQQAIDALHCRFADGFEEDRWWNSTHVIAALKGLPSARPERKTGHWVYRPEWSKYGDVWSCSECGEKTSQSVMGEPRFKYCPMCGAKMEGERKE